MASGIGDSPNRRAPASARPVRSRRRGVLSAVASLGVVGVLAAACGAGGDSSEPAAQTGIAVTAPEPVAEANAAALASRPGEGITAAGGTLAAGEPCPAPGSAGAAGRDTVKIALVTPDVFALEIVGLGNLVFDDPGHIIDAYVNTVNSFGGINGHCFEFRNYVYGFSDPAGDIGRICTELPQEQPLVMLGLGLEDVILGCTTVAAQVPTIGLYAQFPEATFAQAGGLLRVDHGSVEFLVESGMAGAAAAGVLTAADRVALLHQAAEAEVEGMADVEGMEMAHDMGDAQMFGGHMHDPNAPGVATFDAMSRRLGLHVAGWAGVMAEFSGTGVLVIEQTFRDLGGDIFDPEQESFESAAASMPPELARLLTAMRGYFISTAIEMRDAGVTAVVASGEWDDLRNLMRAAELAQWYPKWIINDAQYALLVLTDSPKSQGVNLVQVSSRRAADDPIAGLDRGCLSLRNTGTAAEPFSHRYHTDAWSLMTATCDYLDVVFSAISRVSDPLTRASFVAALSETGYEAAHGQRVRFSAGDPYGSDSFRVLSADPDCVLNDWGCMRPLTDWFEPAAAGSGSGTG